MDIDIRKIRQLISLLQEGLFEIEIREGDKSVRIQRAMSPSSPPNAPVLPQTYTPQTSNPPIQIQSAPTHVDTININPPTAEMAGHHVTAPMVGTVYFAATPQDPPFVTIGQKVKKGDTLCLIEAMKMFNEIEADIAGTVKQALVDNGQPVEYGQPLFVIEE